MLQELLEERRRHIRRRAYTGVRLLSGQRALEGQLTDISSGGFLLSPRGQLILEKGSHAVLQFGHGKLDCQVIGHSPNGVHCRFTRILDAGQYSRLAVEAPGEAKSRATSPTVSERGGPADGDSKTLIKKVLRRLAQTAGAATAALVEVPAAGGPHEILVTIPETGHGLGCPCGALSCRVRPVGTEQNVLAGTAADGRLLCFRRAAGKNQLVIVLQRSVKDPPFSPADEDALGQRAGNLWGFLAAGWDLMRENRQVHVLYGLFENLPMALFMVDSTLRVHDVNPAAAELLKRDDGIALRAGKLVCASVADTARLRQLVNGTISAPGNGLAIERGDSPHPYLVTVIPAKRPTGGRPLFALAVRDLGGTRQAGIDGAAEAFGLTKAETRLAQLLVAGHSLVSATATLGISHNTARSHMKRIYDKTATSRQSQLVQLLSR
jgi:DNA-binding CsgD family transcriptional regulator